MGKIVAVLGIVTGDAPAMEESDIAFAMGLSGTDVCKSASDIMIMDNNFRSILSAIKFGRAFHDNTMKFLQLQMSFTIVVLVLVLTGACILGDEPLSAMQLLWTGFIVEVGAALAFGSLSPDRSVLNSLPRPTMPLSAEMWRNIIG